LTILREVPNVKKKNKKSSAIIPLIFMRLEVVAEDY
jgi:hypothetical protein